MIIRKNACDYCGNEEMIDEDYRYTDTGEVKLETNYGEFSYTNWYFTQYGGGEGEIDITRAIARSTDTFFYKLGEKLGVKNINFWAKEFMLNELTGIDLPGEVKGLIPGPAWKRRIRGEQ